MDTPTNCNLGRLHDLWQAGHPPYESIFATSPGGPLNGGNIDGHLHNNAMQGDNDYVEFDEIENTISAIEMLATVSELVASRPSYWKWMIIAAQDALQAAIVCAVADSTGISVLSERSAKRVLAFLEGKETDYPGEWLADFGELLKRSPLELEQSQADDIRKLHFFRNEFSHFTPMTWCIELAGLPRLVLTALAAIEALLAEQQVQIHLESEQTERIQANMTRARSALTALATTYQAR